MGMLIAVDGGATHCRLACFDQSGGRLAEHRLAQPASLSAGVEQAAATVQQGIEGLQAAVAQSLDGVPLVCGLAGSLRQTLRATFVAAFNGTRSVHVITDGHAQLLGATGGRAGVCLAVGTGSVVHWLDRSGEFGMAGGWGYPAGDEASAAWLGLGLLRGYVRVLDRQQALESVWAELQQHIGKTTEQVQSWTTSSRPSQVGSLAVLVSRHAEQGDEFCRQLINAGADECEQLMSCAPTDLPCCLQGGLSEVYQPILEARGHVFQPACGDALEGLRLHALREAVDD